MSCFFLPFWSRPTNNTFFAYLFGISFFKWQNGHILESVERLVHYVWYLLLQWIHNKDIYLLGSIRDTCFPQKHMTWSLKFTTAPPSVTTLLVDIWTLEVDDTEGFSFKLATTLFEFFELIDRLSLLAKAVVTSLIILVWVSSFGTPKANTFLSVPSSVWAVVFWI